jgi:hypothetical protein
MAPVRALARIRLNSREKSTQGADPPSAIASQDRHQDIGQTSYASLERTLCLFLMPPLLVAQRYLMAVFLLYDCVAALRRSRCEHTFSPIFAGNWLQVLIEDGDFVKAQASIGDNRRN